MAVNFTTEQKQVIELRDRNILVAAAAGSGKTAVLVERIITRLTKDENPLNIDELLIVTFTEAAAAEMKERIQNAVESALEKDPENIHLQQQATLIHQAKITTIHGFCLSVIRDYFHTIDLDPGFRIGEEGELKLLKHDVVESIIEEHYAKGEEDFVNFVECYASGKDDRQLGELILQLYGLAKSQINPEKWLASCVDAYEISNVEELEEKTFVQDIVKDVKRWIREQITHLKYGIELCNSEDGPAVYEDALKADIMLLNSWMECATFGELHGALINAKWARLANNRDKSVDEEKISLVKDIREQMKTKVKSLVEQYFYQSAEKMQADMLAMKDNMQVLASLAAQFAKVFAETKRNKNMIDFDDMERFALKILTEEKDGVLVPSAAAKELQEKFAEVMIDEYQDSNLIQEAILTSVSKISEGVYNVFMVGDVKQSIYKFRLSKPELFMEKYHTYTTDESEKQRIDLHKNFRSRQEVLDSTNFVFEQIMTEEFGGISYDEKAALNLGASYEESEDCETEILLIEKKAQKQERIEEEALAAAKRIKELVGSQEIYDKDTKTYRKARYGDIVILSRSLAGWGDVFASTLEEEGIPTYTSSKEGYFQTREIQLILDYLRILDNPYQDIPFAAVLLSMFVGICNEELALIKSETEEKSLYESAKAYLEIGKSEEIRNKLGRFMEQFFVFREKITYTSIHNLLWKIVKDTGYGDYVAALPGGEQRNANVEMLLAKAIAFESTSYKGLFNFVRYIEQLHKYDVDYGEASLAEDQLNAVSLMTIHKSKGLEFPIVFLVGTGKQFNIMDANNSVIAHAEYGVGLEAIDPVLRTKIPTLLKKSIQKNIVLESKAEELRILYVAMTRAKEKLIMTYCTKNLEGDLQGLNLLEKRKEKNLPYGDLTKAKCYMDWILPSLYRNCCMADVLEAYGIRVPFGNPMFLKKVPFYIEIVTEDEIVKSQVEVVYQKQISKHILENWNTDVVYHEEMKEQIEEQFGYMYPMGDQLKIKQKMSVSELKKRAYEEELGEVVYKEEDVIPLLPNFLQEKTGISGAMKGTIYHKVLELLDFSKVYSKEMLQTDIQNFVEKGFMNEEEASCISLHEIETFLASSVGQRVHKASAAGKFHAEQPFVLGISAKEVYGQEASDETVLVQGIIDVYFEEEDGLTVLDYKTDKVFSAKELADKYRAQLAYYAKALERLTGKTVKQKLIYSFTLQKEIEV